MVVNSRLSKDALVAILVDAKKAVACSFAFSSDTGRAKEVTCRHASRQRDRGKKTLLLAMRTVFSKFPAVDCHAVLKCRKGQVEDSGQFDCDDMGTGRTIGVFQ